MEDKNNNFVETAGVILSSYLQKNFVDPESLPVLVHSVLKALRLGVSENHGGLHLKENIADVLSQRSSFLPDRGRKPIPAVPIEQSVTAEYIICLEDGKKFRSLKRHLRSSYNITPDEYRKKWNLPDDYPMVSPGYASLRSKLAKKIHLGSKS